MDSKRRPPLPVLPADVLVAREVLRALGSALALPFRVLDYWIEREAARAEVRADLSHVPELAPLEARLELPERPLRVFISCAEASGEIHALNFVDALRERLRAAGAPEPEFVGLGGPQLAARGVRLLADPVSSSIMGFAGVLARLPFYLGILRGTARAFRRDAPDLFVPIDSPALHVPLAHIARSCGVRVVHFVAPQYWGWAPWRVGGYRKAVDLALTILPFEPAWFERRGVAVAHVGHPLLDELSPRAPHAANEAEVCRRVVLFPGSRRGVIKRNLATMLSALELARAPGEQLEVVIAQRDEQHRALIESVLAQLDATEHVELRVGSIDATLEGAGLALSVSGTILMHLLHYRLPAVVVYRVENAREDWLADQFLTAPYFASVNLLAGREVYPEFSFHERAPAQDLVAALERGLHDATWRAACREQLEQAAERLGPPGATRRAALAALRPWIASGEEAPR